MPKFFTASTLSTTGCKISFNKLSLIKKLSIKLKASENVVKSKMSNYLDDVENGVVGDDEEMCMYNHCCRATLSTNGSTWRMYCNYPDRYRRI